MTMVQLVKARELTEALVALVRAVGLHRPDRTPCGQPISVAEAHALLDLQAAGPISQRDLAAGLRLEKSTVSRLVRLMESRGWVKRTPAAHDRRVMHVSLSEAGQVAAQHLAQARGAKFARVLAALPQEKRVRVVEAVAALAEAARAATAPDA
jgi:DNA-binding MarR family transcriptional regulator